MVQTVAYLAGGNNWVPCFVSVYSLLDNNPDLAFRIVVFTEEDRENPFFENIDTLENIHDEFTIEYVNIPLDQFDNLPSEPEQNAMFPKAMYAKLLIPELFPDPPERFLYLDTDTLVLNDLACLFQQSISDTTVAAAPDIKNRIAGLGAGLDKQYFNAGVMYINTHRWLETDVTAACLEFIQTHKPTYMDQTALNAVLHRRNEVEIISPTYNLISEWKENADPNIRVSFDWDDMTIVHYAGVPKPWQSQATDEFNEPWLSYYDKTPFDDFYSEHGDTDGTEYLIEALKPFSRVRAIARRFSRNS